METDEILAAIQEAAKTIATPNWADKLSVILSFLAIVVAAGVAVYVAKKQNEIAKKQNEISQKQAEIAEQQNKISLLEERITIYVIGFCCKNIAEKILKSAKNSKEAINLFQVTIIKVPFIFSTLTINQDFIGETDIKLILEKLTHAEYSFSEEVAMLLATLAVQLVYLMFYDNEEFNIQKDRLRRILKRIDENKIFEKAKNELRL